MKRKIRYFIIIVSFSLLTLCVYSQSNICNDGIDNDFDSLVDSADRDCDFGFPYFPMELACSNFNPVDGSPFDQIAMDRTGQSPADTQSKVAVGDVDGDGIPDAIITSKWNAQIHVVATRAHTVSGTSYKLGWVKSGWGLTGQGAAPFNGTGGCNPKNLLFEHEVLMADIDKDKKAEIFGVVSNRSGNPDSPPNCFFLVGFTYTKSTLTLLPGYPVQIGPDSPGIPGITDFDGDGKAEIYLKNKIYAAENGTLLADGGGNWDTEINSAPMAVNILGDSKQELVCGNFIYSVPNLSARTLQSLSVAKNMNLITGLPVTNKYFPKVYNDDVEYGNTNHSSTAVSDLDNDSNLDVVISGAINSSTGATAVFYWNVAKEKVSVFNPTYPGNSLGWPWGTSRLNIADADGDGSPNVNFTAGNQLFSLKADGDILSNNWSSARTINISRTGLISCTVYDFDNDGNPELVYRDSKELVVVDGKTGTTKLWSSACLSHSYNENPLIVDANGDGKTDICVPCFRTNNGLTIDGGLQQQALGEVRLYYSETNEWLPTRKIWNQPGYNVVNINDNLSIPRTQLEMNFMFSDSSCPDGKVGPQKPLNTFLNQIPYLGPNGCAIFPAYDLDFYGDEPGSGIDTNGDGDYTPIVETFIREFCDSSIIKIGFTIVNTGSLQISATIPVSFFKGDPRINSSALLLYSTAINLYNLDVGKVFVVGEPNLPYIEFNGPGDAFDLFIVLNNDGSSLPVVLTGQNQIECSFENNIFSVPITGTLTATTVGQDHFTISWPNVFEPDAYLIDVSIDSTFSTFVDGFNRKMLPATATSVFVNGLSSGTLYYFRLIAVLGLTENNLCSTRKQITIPDTPTFFDIISASDHQFMVKWNTVKGVEYYEVDVSLFNNNFSVLTPGYNGKKVPATNDKTLITVLDNLGAGTAYISRVRAVNDGGKSGNSTSVPFLTSGTFKPMKLSVIEFNNGKFSGVEILLKAIVSDAIGDYSVDAEFRKITKDETISITEFLVSNDTLTVPIKGNFLDELGVEISLSVTDQFGQHSAVKKLIYWEFSDDTSPIFIRGSFSGDHSSMQIIANPYVMADDQINSIFVSQLGGYNKKTWRLAHYDPVLQKNIEFEDGLVKIERGQGYWFNAKKDSDLNIQAGKGSVGDNNRNTPFVMKLNPGWNQIGNPYPFPINWFDVLEFNSTDESVGNLILYDGYNKNYKEANRNLNTFQGGFVYSENEMVLQVPVSINLNAGRKGFYKIGSNLMEAEWQVPLTISNGNTTFTLAAFGMSPSARTGKDNLDLPQLPKLQEYLDLAFPHPEDKHSYFVKDFIPATEKASWTFIIDSNLPENHISLSWKNTFGENEAKLFLLDIDEAKWIDMRANSQYEFSISSSRMFKTYFSKAGDVYPDVLLFGKPFPNPSVDAITCSLILPDSQASFNVLFEVVDALGRTVYSVIKPNLKPGTQELSWDRIDNTGNMVGSGVYMLRATVDGKLFPRVYRVILK